MRTKGNSFIQDIPIFIMNYPTFTITIHNKNNSIDNLWKLINNCITYKKVTFKVKKIAKD